MKPATKTEIAAIAAAISGERPDLAARLRALLPRPRGRPTGATGNGERNEWLADIWCEVADAIEQGEAEADVLAAAERRTGLPESIVCDLWNRRRPAVNDILRKRGRLK